MEEKMLLIFYVLIPVVFSTPISNNVLQDDSCQLLPKCHQLDKDKINVHLVPHSHDDVGWLKTVEEYYYGRNDSIQNVGVQYIIESVLQALKVDSRRRFIQVETAFFWEWWKSQNKERKDLYKTFVNNGQIEMVGGGWSMNDEACTNYQSVINQFTLGLRILSDTLGECGKPKIGWQIDPFGHSREQASIFKQLGFDAIFFVRLSKSDKDQRILNQNLEFLWKSSDELDNSEIFTSIFSTDSYFAPNGFCWDYLQCNADAINDDPDSFDYNLDKKIEDFSEFIANYSKYYKTNNILFAMGGDFQYQAAERNYMNIDKIIKGFQNNAKYNVFYSTPSCYYEAVMSAKPNLSMYIGDFFPYAENDHAYWSGYYTSRPTIKKFERMGNNILQVSKHLNAFSKMRNLKIDNKYEQNIRSLEEVMGTMQHHDAITGTEKEHVAKDYVRILTKAIKDADHHLGTILGNLLKKDNITDDITLPVSTCLLRNVSICENSLKDKFMVAVYNPLSRYITHYVRLPANNSTYNITGPDGEEIYDIAKNMDHPVNYSSVPSQFDLIFAARNVPPMGIKYYYIQRLDQSIENNYKDATDVNTFGTSYVNFTLDNNNLLESVTMNNKTVKISQKFLAYISNNGSGDYISSGAYLFRPINGSDAYSLNYFENGEVNETISEKVSATFYRGNLVDEVIQVYNKWLTQTIRVYKGEENNFIEFDWIVGPIDNNTIDTKYNHGKEVISRFYISNFNNEVFFTDSNGREMIERKRKDFPYNNSEFEPVTSNYYPVTSKIVIKDESEDLQLAILNDRSQGGSSLWGGEVELMVHRRMLRDDGKGVDESLEETEYGDYLVVRGQHYLILGAVGSNSDSNLKDTSVQERELSLKKLLQPWILVGDATSDEWSLDNIQKTIHLEWSGLKTALPDTVNILTLEPWKDDSYLLRLEHIVGKQEGSNSSHSKDIFVNITELFDPYTITDIRETTLAANNWLDTSVKETDDSPFDQWFGSKSLPLVKNTDANISLTPMQIRTFIIELSK